MSLTRNIVGCWSPSLGATGYLLRDVSGQNNHGTLTNMDPGTDWVASDKGVVLDFDGSNDNITIARSVQFAGSSLTVCGWVRTNNANLQQVLVNQGTTTNQFILFYQSGWIMRGASATEMVFGSLTANTWTHVAGVFSGTSATGYLQGLFSGGGTITAAAANLSTNLEIGRYAPFGGGFYWIGQIGEIAIYNRALTAPEISELYRRGNGWLGRELTGINQRRTYAKKLANRRRRILCGGMT